jgi:hypothetical protein
MYHVSSTKKENELFLIYKEIQMWSVAKSYKWKGLLIYEKMCKYLTYMRRLLVIYDFATDPFWIFLYMYNRKILFSFLSVQERCL